MPEHTCGGFYEPYSCDACFEDLQAAVAEGYAEAAAINARETADQEVFDNDGEFPW